MSDLFPKFDFSARRAELEAELEVVAAQLPALRAAAAAAETTAENARYRYESFLKRATLATRHGNDTASFALRRLLDEELQLMRAANSAATRARLALENAEWMAACRRESRSDRSVAEPTASRAPAGCRQASGAQGRRRL
jgi:hypothetical protein